MRGSNPGSTFASRSIVRTISTDPESSTIATATSAIIKLRRSDVAERVNPRPDRTTSSWPPMPEALTAGTTPKTNAHAPLNSVVHANTTRSRRISSRRGRSRGARLTRPARMPAPARAPSTLPVTTSSACSVRSWRIRTDRLPPIAARILNSWTRDALLFSSSVARFTHAMSRSSMTAPTRTVSVGATSWMTRSASATSSTPLLLPVFQVERGRDRLHLRPRRRRR